MKKNKENACKNKTIESDYENCVGIKVCSDQRIARKFKDLRMQETKKTTKSGKTKQLSARELGEKLDDKYKLHRYSQAKVNNLEKGINIQISDIGIYADYFHKSTDYFIYDFEDTELEENSSDSPIGLTKESAAIIRSMPSVHKTDLNYFIESGFIQDINDIFDKYEFKNNRFTDYAIQVLNNADSIIKEHMEAEKAIASAVSQSVETRKEDKPEVSNDDLPIDAHDCLDIKDDDYIGYMDGDYVYVEPNHDYEDLLECVVTGATLIQDLMDELEKYFKNSLVRTIKEGKTVEEGKIFSLINKRLYAEKIAAIYAGIPERERLWAIYQSAVSQTVVATSMQWKPFRRNADSKKSIKK